jgi:Domain of unknown function (DUF4349)
MSEARFETLLQELRVSAPPAPQRLRERVSALREPAPRPAFRLRPALAAAVVIAISIGVGAAAIGGLTSSPADKNVAATPSAAERLDSPTGSTRAVGEPLRSAPTNQRSFAPLLPGSRLQRYDVSMSARVDDLSSATKSAVRVTRRLGGYVAGADYSADQSTGDSRLDLRVPVQHVQRAIARFTELGTILSQRISVADLQATADRFQQRRSAFRRVIARLEAKQRDVGLTPAERRRLDGARRTATRLSKARASLIREGAYAKISLLLTTRKPAVKDTEPGRFDRFWGDAGDILGKEAIIVLYALVVAGPFVLLAVLALLAERARRRRADSRLLEETT